MIGFLQPLYLALAASAAGAVVAIHFLSRRRAGQSLPFTQLALLESILQRRRKLNKIQNWMLLLLRSLAAALILAALAKPYWHWSGHSKNEAAREGPFWLAADLSYSMQQRHGDGRSGLEKSKQAALAVLRELPRKIQKPRVGLIAFTDKTHEEFSLEPTDNLAQLESRIRELPLFPRPTRHGAWKEHLSLQKEKPQGAWIFSDFAAHGFSGSGAPGHQPLPEIPLMLIRADSGGRSNRRIHVSPSPDGASARVKIECFGNPPAGKAAPVQILEAPGRKTVLTAPAPECGEQEVKLPAALKDSPLLFQLSPDALDWDDSQAFVADRRQSAPALIVDGEPGRRANEGESFYLRQAFKILRPSGGWSTAGQEEFSSLVSRGDWKNSVSELWLLNPQKMERRMREALESFIADSSKKIIITLGPGSDTDSLERLLGLRWEKSRAPAGARIAPASAPRWLGGLPWTGLSEFELGQITVSQYLPLAPQTALEKIWLTVEHNGISEPLLYEPPRRGARIFIFSSTFDTAWSNMPIKGFFQAMADALDRETASPRIPLNVVLGEEIRYPQPPSAWKELQAASPSGQKMQARVLENQLVLGPFEETGLYELLWPSGFRPPGAPRWIASSLAYPSPESDLAPASSRQISAFLGNEVLWKEMSAARTAAEPEAALSLLSSEPFSRPLIAAALGLLGLESLAGFIIMTIKKKQALK